MPVDFKDFQKNIDEKINYMLQQIIKKIDDFIGTENGKLEFIKSGKMFFDFKKDKVLLESCQNYAIQEALREIYLGKGWHIKYEYRWYCCYGLPVEDKIIGITFQKPHESLVE